MKAVKTTKNFFDPELRQYWFNIPQSPYANSEDLVMFEAETEELATQYALSHWEFCNYYSHFNV